MAKLIKKEYTYFLESQGIEVKYTKVSALGFLALKREFKLNEYEGDEQIEKSIEAYAHLIHQNSDLNENTIEEIKEILTMEEITDLGMRIAGLENTQKQVVENFIKTQS